MAKQSKKNALDSRKQDDVSGFLQKLHSLPRVNVGELKGRLLFCLDATASRESMWDQACQIQGEMFVETKELGGLEVQLVYYRGFEEFSFTKWTSRPDDLIKDMISVKCLGGRTQINKILLHALEESRKGRVSAIVFVGDSMEEDPDTLCHIAGKLGMRNLPVFVFQEGYDHVAKSTFVQIARLSGGAWCNFDSSSPQQLRDLLSAVAVYAAGGRRALLNYGKNKKGEVLRIAQQLK